MHKKSEKFNDGKYENSGYRQEDRRTDGQTDEAGYIGPAEG